MGGYIYIPIPIPIPSWKFRVLPIPIPIPSQSGDSRSKRGRVRVIPTGTGLFAISSLSLFSCFLNLLAIVIYCTIYFIPWIGTWNHGGKISETRINLVTETQPLWKFLTFVNCRRRGIRGDINIRIVAFDGSCTSSNSNLCVMITRHFLVWRSKWVWHLKVQSLIKELRDRRGTSRVSKDRKGWRRVGMQGE